VSNNDDWPSLAEKDAGTFADHFVLVLEDGSARELAPDEKAHLNAKYDRGDGNRPAFNVRYVRREEGPGRIGGYLLRTRLPPDVPVGPAILLGGAIYRPEESK
jgi:hypothetical protein